MVAPLRPPLDSFAVKIEQLKCLFADGAHSQGMEEEGSRLIQDLMRDCSKEERREELLCLLPDLVKRHPLLCTVLVMRRDNFLKSCQKWAGQFVKALTDPTRDPSKPRALLVQLLDFLELLPSTAKLIDSLADSAASAFLREAPRDDIRAMFFALEASLSPGGTVSATLQKPECRLTPVMKGAVEETLKVIVQNWKKFDARAWWSKCEAHSNAHQAAAHSSGSGSSSSSNSSSSSAASFSSPQRMIDTQSAAAVAPSVLLSPTAADAEDLYASSTSGFSRVDRLSIDGPMHLSHSSGSASSAASSFPVAKKPRRGAANADLPRFNAHWNAEPLVISDEDEEALDPEAEMYKRPISPRAASQAAATAAAAAAGIAAPAGSKRKRVDMNTSENTVRRYDPLSFTFVDDPNFKLKSILKGPAAAAGRMWRLGADAGSEGAAAAGSSASAAAAAAAPASILPARYAHSDDAALYRDLLSLPPMSLSPLSAEVTSSLLGGYIPALEHCLPAFATHQGRFPGGSRGSLTSMDLTRAFSQGIMPCLALHPQGHRWLPHWSLLFAQLLRIQELHYDATKASHGHSSNGQASRSSHSSSSAQLPPLGSMLASLMDPLVGRHWTDDFVTNRPVDLATLMKIAKGNVSYEGAAAAASSAAASNFRAANGASAAPPAPSPSFPVHAAAAGGAPEPRSPVPQFGPEDHDDMMAMPRRKNR